MLVLLLLLLSGRRSSKRQARMLYERTALCSGSSLFADALPIGGIATLAEAEAETEAAAVAVTEAATAQRQRKVDQHFVCCCWSSAAGGPLFGSMLHVVPCVSVCGEHTAAASLLRSPHCQHKHNDASYSFADLMRSLFACMRSLNSCGPRRESEHSYSC